VVRTGCFVHRQNTETSYGALDAFFAGTLAMNNDLKCTTALQNSNFKIWILKGIEPESMNYITMEVENGSYSLRPANIEGAYFLYQYTLEERYLEMGSTMVNNLVKYCRTNEAYAALNDVRTKEKRDYMESLLFA
jgi:hypothetical protein